MSTSSLQNTLSNAGLVYLWRLDPFISIECILTAESLHLNCLVFIVSIKSASKCLKPRSFPRTSISLLTLARWTHASRTWCWQLLKDCQLSIVTKHYSQGTQSWSQLLQRRSTFTNLMSTLNTRAQHGLMHSFAKVVDSFMFRPTLVYLMAKFSWIMSNRSTGEWVVNLGLSLLIRLVLISHENCSTSLKTEAFNEYCLLLTHRPIMQLRLVLVYARLISSQGGWTMPSMTDPSIFKH